MGNHLYPQGLKNGGESPGRHDDGVKWLIKRKIADPKRIACMAQVLAVTWP